MSIITTVPQGQHYDTFGGGSIHSPAGMECEVTFHPSCQYDLGNNNQFNWNKLMGFFDSPAGEVRSVRWGWRWSLANACIEIAPFIHQGGSFLLPPSSQWIQVPLHAAIKLQIQLERSANEYRFVCVQEGIPTEIVVGVSESLAQTYRGVCRWDLLYFGGSQAAPHEVTIEYDKLVFSNCKRIQGGNQSWRVAYIDPRGERSSAYGGAYVGQTIAAREGSIVVTMGNPQITGTEEVV